MNISIWTRRAYRSGVQRKRVDILHISPSHHYPTGIVMPVSRRYELLGWAAKSNSHYIIEDDYDSELRLGGQPIPTMQSIDVSDRVIYMNTFTKTLASTVRISYMILPPPLLEQFYERLSFYSCSVSNFEQYTLGKFIEEGFFEKHINRLRNHYHKKRDILLGAIRESRLGDLVHISGEEAGVHFLMEIQTEKEEEEFLTCAQTQGIRLSPLSAHYHNRETERKNVYVMNYSSVQMEDTQEIVRRLERCV
ncbi:MAG: PLP-dependent aminotransferase family protein [Lachnospiraceae bacterium]